MRDTATAELCMILNEGMFIYITMFENTYFFKFHISFKDTNQFFPCHSCR